MARLAKVVVPQGFRADMDYAVSCLSWLSGARRGAERGMSYLMPKQGHLIAVPAREERLARVSDGAACLARDERSADADVRKPERTGQPLGDDLFIDRVTRLTGRARAMKKPGRKERDGK